MSCVHGSAGTLIGRKHLWQALIPLGMRHPILGAGFGGFWTPTMVQDLKEVFIWGPGQAHNGYIEIFLHLGMVGLVLFGLVVVTALTGGMRQMYLGFEYGRVRLILVVLTLVHNYSESGFIRPTHLIWFTFLLASVNVWQGLPSQLEEPSKSL